MANRRIEHNQGETDLLSGLYQRYRVELSRYVGKTVNGGPPEPEDVVQQAFAQFAALENPGSIDNPRAYLYRTAHNIVVEYHRTETRRRRLEGIPQDSFEEQSDELTPETVLIGKERIAVMKETLRQMPQARRRSFLMNRVQGLSCAEIARRTGYSESGVKKHVLLALREIEAALTAAEQAAGDKGSNP